MTRASLAAAFVAALTPAVAGCGGRPAFTKAMVLGGETVSARRLNRGRDVYEVYCFSCHGLKGDGRGPAAVGLRPPARDFTLGLFKFAGVPSGQLPRDTDFVESRPRRTPRHRHASLEGRPRARPPRRGPVPQDLLAEVGRADTGPRDRPRCGPWARRGAATPRRAA